MGIGMRIRQFTRLRAGGVVAVALGLVAAAWAAGGITLAPPGLKSRQVDIASATTQVVIDTPRSAVLDVRQDTYAIQSLTERAILLGNVITSGPVREYIAQQASIPVRSLEVAAPLTSEQPRARAELGVKKGPTELVKSNTQYRLAIRANPTVPVLSLYAQAPTAEVAERIANGAVEGLRRYLGEVALEQKTSEQNQIRLLQLGEAAPSGVINKGARWELAVVAFLAVFGISCAAFVLLRRVRAGYRLAVQAEHGAVG